MRCVAIVVAAGRGTRAGGALPKQYQNLGTESVLRRTLRAFADHPDIDGVLAVIHADDSSLFQEAANGLPKMLAPAFGGATRQESVLAGLQSLAAEPPALVLVHDGARPFVSPELIARAVAAADTLSAAIPVLPVTDTIKQVNLSGEVVATPDRATLRAVQTPQAFRFRGLLSAHGAASRAGVTTLTDDAAVMEWAGFPVSTFEGEAANIKITTAEDLRAAASADTGINAPATTSEDEGDGLAPLSALGDLRTGSGFDVHAFGPGDHVMLGGVAIPHTAGLAGHSDADVGLHALTDAVLGALGDGDIGAHFPPSDPQWKGASSDRFLAHAVWLVHTRGGRIAHLDLTLICEAPKIGPHREAIRAAVARIAGLPESRVSVKATTTERLGFTGRREGIAALASATIRLPFGDEP